MTLEDAFEIVHDLAVQNILTDRELAEDSEVLGPMQQAQIKACDIVHDFIANVVCERQTHQ